MAYEGLQLLYNNARDEAHLPVRRILFDFLILEFSADETFEGKNHVRRVNDGLLLGR